MWTDHCRQPSGGGLTLNRGTADRMTPGKQSNSPRAPLHFLGLACAIGVSTIYFNQPLLVDMGGTYHQASGRVMFVSGATQVGYALGLLLFVPLGDLLERRSLMLRMYASVVISLLLVSMAPSLGWLIAGSVLLGMVAAVTHIVLPIAPDMVPNAERGRAIGTVMMGLLLGILLARTFAGWVSRAGTLLIQRHGGTGFLWLTDGWRFVFAVAAIGNLAFLLVLARVMPKLPPKQEMRYGEAMRSLWTLFRTEPLLRESSLIGALVFASFSCFWTTLAFLLSSHYGFGAGVAGSFGLVGAAGAFVAPIGGRLADRRGARAVLSAGISLLAVSYVLLWAGEWVHIHIVAHIAVLVVGVIVLDIGAQLTQVGNQTRIFGLVPSARSRLNTVYMTVYFSGAALGSALSTVAWVRWKWDGVCAMALVLVGCAFLTHAMGMRSEAGVPARGRADVADSERVLEV
jgi:predicted MFS family arabinose efflux permease